LCTDGLFDLFFFADGDNLALVEELESGVQEASLDPEEVAEQRKKDEANKKKNMINKHNNGVSKQTTMSLSAMKQLKSAEDTITANSALISKLVSQYGVTNSAGEASKIENQIETLKSEVMVATQTQQDAEAAKGSADEKIKFHRSELEKLHASAPMSAEAVEAKIVYEKNKSAMKAKADGAEETKKLKDHMKVSAMQAANLAFENKELLDKLNANADDTQTAKDVSKTKATLESIQLQITGKEAQLKTASGDTKIGIESDLALLSKQKAQHQDTLDNLTASKVVDPIDRLTPGGKMGVLKKRQEIRILKSDMKSKVATFEQDTKNLEMIIKETETNIGKETDKTELDKLDRKLKEWQIAKVDLGKKNKIEMVSDETKLGVLQQEEQTMLTKGTPVAKNSNEREVSASEKAAAEKITAIQNSLKSVISSLNDVEIATTERDVSAATEMKTRDEIQAKKIAQAATPSSATAAEIAGQITALQNRVVAQKEAALKAKGQFEVIKEVSEKKQQYFVEAANSVKENVAALRQEASKAPNADQFEAVNTAINEINEQLEAAEKEKTEIVKKYEAKVKALEEAAAAAKKAIKDAMTVAEDSVNKVSALEAKKKETVEPDALQALQAEIEAAKTAQDDALAKLDAAKASDKSRKMAVLVTDGADAEMSAEDMKKAKADLKVTQDNLNNKQEEARKLDADAMGDPTNVALRTSADAANAEVRTLQAAAKALADKVALAEATSIQASLSAAKSKAEAETAAAKAQLVAEKANGVHYQTTAVEATEEMKRVKSENNQLKKTVESLSAPAETDEEAEAKMKGKIVAETTENLETEASTAELSHEVDKSKMATAKISELETQISKETDGLTKMKVRIRQLEAHKDTVPGVDGKKLLTATIEGEKQEEDLIVSQLKINVQDEKMAQDKLKGYHAHLEIAQKRRDAALLAQKNRVKANEEGAMKKEAKKTEEERAESAKAAAKEKAMLNMKVHELKKTIAIMKQDKTSDPAELEKTEKELTYVQNRLSQDEQKATLAKYANEKAQFEAIQVKAVIPARKAKEEMVETEAELNAMQKDVEVQEEKIKELMDAQQVQQTAVIEATIESDKIAATRRLAKATGLLEAAQETLKDKKVEVEEGQKKLATATEESTDMEARKKQTLALAPVAVQRKVADAEIAEHAAKEKAAMEVAETKRKADAKAELLVVKPSPGHVETKVSKIIAASTARAAAAPIATLKAPAVATVWHGNTPESGVLPTKPANAAEANADAVNKAEADKAAKAKAEKDAEKAASDAEVASENVASNNELITSVNADINASLKPDEMNMLDSAVEFLQTAASKWLWHGAKPEGGVPIVPKYMKVAAGDTMSAAQKKAIADAKAKASAEVPVQDFGVVEEANNEESAQEKRVESAKAHVEMTRAKAHEAETAAASAPEGTEKVQLQSRADELRTAADAAKNALGVAQEALEHRQMQVDVARVGAGTEGAEDGIDAVLAAMRKMAADKMGGATAVVDHDELEADHYSKQRATAFADKKKMREIESSAQSPAVKDAAASMQNKESDEMLFDLQETLAYRLKAQKARIAKRSVGTEVEEESKKMKKAVDGIKAEMKEARTTTKNIMTFEGKKYKKSMRSYAGDKVSIAQLQVKLEKDKAAAEVTPSLQKKEELDKAIERAKRRKFILKTRRVRSAADANLAVEAQHNAAKELKATLAEGIEKVIALKIPKESEPEMEAKGKQEAEAIEIDTEATIGQNLKFELAQLQKSLSDTQQERIDISREILTIGDQIKSLVSDPLPELPKDVTPPQGLADRKRADLSAKKTRMEARRRVLAKSEVKLALEIERTKKKIHDQQMKAHDMIRKSTALANQARVARENSLRQRYGAQQQLSRSKKATTKHRASIIRAQIEESSIEAQHKMEDARNEAEAIASSNRDDFTPPAQAAGAEANSEINKMKGDVVAAQNKLKTLSSKISGVDIAEVEASGKGR